MFFLPVSLLSNTLMLKNRKWTLIQTKLSASPSVCERVDFISLLLSFLKPTHPHRGNLGLTC